MIVNQTVINTFTNRNHKTHGLLYNTAMPHGVKKKVRETHEQYLWQAAPES